MTRRYAEKTDVPSERTEIEIRKLLAQHGAEQFLSGIARGAILVGFTLRDRQIRFMVPLPNREDFAKDASGKARTAAVAAGFHDAEIRRLWRALLLTIKAKFESAQSGIETFEDAFLANIVLPNGRTVGEASREPIAIAYESGESVPLLPDMREARDRG